MFSDDDLSGECLRRETGTDEKGYITLEGNLIILLSHAMNLREKALLVSMFSNDLSGECLGREI